uniref:Uncharacterized protein n=1 Tax=Cacopsylla melanoneura TaxID=428564 RepID=A0A8D9BFW7_9HEMI
MSLNLSFYILYPRPPSFYSRQRAKGDYAHIVLTSHKYEEKQYHKFQSYGNNNNNHPVGNILKGSGKGVGDKGAGSDFSFRMECLKGQQSYRGMRIGSWKRDVFKVGTGIFLKV